ncbi:MAG: M16 family metallopeptidase, partial [Planctomycetota bacterium]
MREKARKTLILSRLWPVVLLTWATVVASAEAQSDAPAYDYRQFELPNGLRVITLEDHSCPIVSVQVWYHVGSKNEDPERQGFAHMFEHMMFRGTDRLGPTDHFDLIRRTGGTTNGYTNFYTTVYLETLPANQLELALWLEAERMALLRIDQESFETERKVVEEERRLGLNRPFGTMMEKTMAEMFKVHPYRWTPIGNIPHLRAAKVGELRDFWNRYYVPNNATLIVVGDVTHEQVRRSAKEYLGWIPRVEDPPRVTVREPLAGEKRSATIREKNAPVPVVMVAYRAVPVAHDDSVPLELLGTILAGGQSSRLYRDLVAENQLAVAAQAMNFSLEQDGMFALYAVMGPTG